ncbi:hypothetical protein [Alienimonas californiensis]|uniref:Uncharacterized protein n=1 Tax=Alienimonas californiensis TaxID=2527989 RepID=A0A517P7E9_9PLAN|nr:hypothetical protein [Alienimonas californiensis]QDT15304.1 hypothetical protein CA12_13870 [Alienimonas californiensis]
MSDLAARYAALRAEATALAGQPADIRQRAALLHRIYLDSGGNHAFAEIAAHGALWAYGFFETTGTLGRVISYRYALNGREMIRRHAMLQGFADGFKEANRSVFVDTYSQFYLTAELNDPTDATVLVGGDLVPAMATIHEASRRGRLLDADVRRELFQSVLRREQTVTVGPKVDEEFAKFDCPILRACVMKPPVRFAYFPRWTWFWFRNFQDTEERVRRAHRCFDIAEAVGWTRVFDSMQTYRVLPPEFFVDPPGYAAALKGQLLSGAKLAA